MPKLGPGAVCCGQPVFCEVDCDFAERPVVEDAPLPEFTLDDFIEVERPAAEEEDDA